MCVIAGAQAQEQASREDIPLSRQLEGLSLEPRIAYLRYLLETERADPEIYFQLGVAFHEGSEPDSAIRYYEKAVAVDPGYTKAYVNMGVLYDDQGKSEQALQMFEEATRKNEEDILGFAHAAFIRFHIRDYSTAWKHLTRALEIDPDHPQPHFYLAIFFWESGIYREALREWEQVIALDPEGSLGRKARENITMLQKAMNTPSASAGKPIK